VKTTKLRIIASMIIMVPLVALTTVGLTRLAHAADAPLVTIISGPSGATNDATPVFEFIVSDNVVATNCSIDANVPVACTSPYVASALSNGPHTFTVSVVDSLSNTDSASRSFVVDTTPPETMITRLGATPAITPTTDFVLTSTEAATFECNLDNGGYSSCDASYTTPSLSDGPHTLLVRATDSAGNVDASPAIEDWTVDTSTVDTDADGIYDTIENASPNGGDANDDGTPDAGQPTVASFVNPVSNHYQAIVSDCGGVTNIQTGAESSSPADAGFDYPAGLSAFWTSIEEQGSVCHFSQYFYGLPENTSYVFRNSAHGIYSTVSGYTLTTETIVGQSVVKVTYEITDGGTYDDDGEVNGTIIDPMGLGLPVVGAPNTGL